MSLDLERIIIENKPAVDHVIALLLVDIDAAELNANTKNVHENLGSILEDMEKKGFNDEYINKLPLILPIILLLASKTNNNSTKILFESFGFNFEEELKPHPDIMEIQMGGGILNPVLYKIYKLMGPKMFLLMWFIGLLYIGYWGYIETVNIRTKLYGSNLFVAFDHVKKMYTCNSELTSSQKLFAKTFGASMNLIGRSNADATPFITNLFKMNECIINNPTYKYEYVEYVSAHPIEETNDGGIIKYSNINNNINQFIKQSSLIDKSDSTGLATIGYTSALVPPGYTFEPVEITKEIAKIYDDVLASDTEKSIKAIDKLTNIYTNQIKPKTTTKENNMVVIQKEESYAELVYNILKDTNPDTIIKNVRGMFVGTINTDYVAAEIKKQFILLKQAHDKQKIDASAFIEILQTEIPVYIKSIFALHNYYMWFMAKCIGFAAAITAYRKYQLLTNGEQQRLTNDEDELFEQLTNGNGVEPRITNGEEQRITRRRRGGKKILKKRFTQKSSKKRLTKRRSYNKNKK